MKKLAYLMSVFALILFTSCERDNLSNFHLGEVEYHPSFWWSKAQTKNLTKTFHFDFSKDAIEDKNCYAILSFVDQDGKIISPEVMTLEVDGDVLSKNQIRVNSSDKKLKVTYSFSAEVKEGKYQGFIRLTNHQLDRYENIELERGESANISKWSVNYNKGINPLQLVIYILLSCVVLVLLFWFMCIKSILYPRFRKGRKSLIIQKNGQVVEQKTALLTGARIVYFSSKRVKQSALNRIFTGKTITIVSPHFEDTMKFTPYKKKHIRVNGMNYYTTPNPMPMNGIGTIENNSKKITININ